MPRAFSEARKDQIRERLLRKGREYFIRYGLKKTSVDDLVKAAGISKGSFYRFFESKEALFLTIHEASEEALHRDMMQKLGELIKGWQEEGTVRPLDAGVAANMIASVYFIILQNELLGDDMFGRVREMFIECLVQFLCGESG